MYQRVERKAHRRDGRCLFREAHACRESAFGLRNPSQGVVSQDWAFNAFSISALRTVSIFSGVTGPTIL